MNRTIPKTFALAACLFPAALAALSAIAIATRQCMWHGGDDPGWAARQLDESGWQLFSG